MYVVRSKKGQPLAHFKTKREAEVYVRVHSASRSPREDEAARKHREAILNRAKRTRATYQRRASGAAETFRAVATGHRGDTLGTWTGPSMQGLMATVDHALPLTKAWSVTIRGEYTSDGTWHPNHGGRVVASREAGPDRGRGGWITY